MRPSRESERTARGLCWRRFGFGFGTAQQCTAGNSSSVYSFASQQQSSANTSGPTGGSTVSSSHTSQSKNTSDSRTGANQQASGSRPTSGSRSPKQLQDIREKVTKLLRQAADREGTPEGDTFREKAFALMAKYGVEESQLEGNRFGSANEVVFTFSGTYTDLQFSLLNYISHALHCVCVRQSLHGRQTVPQANVFGMPHHVDRVEMLFSVLNPIMIAGANRYAATLWADAVHTRRAKRSWMMGFTRTIANRLRAIENEHSAQYARDGQSGELVLTSDFNRAEAAAFERFPGLSKHTLNSSATLDQFAFLKGINTGEMQDLGQKRVRKNQPAIDR